MRKQNRASCESDRSRDATASVIESSLGVRACQCTYECIGAIDLYDSVRSRSTLKSYSLIVERIAVTQLYAFVVTREFHSHLISSRV